MDPSSATRPVPAEATPIAALAAFCQQTVEGFLLTLELHFYISSDAYRRLRERGGLAGGQFGPRRIFIPNDLTHG